MRTVSSGEQVRLYHLDPDSGATTTLFYGPLDAALREAVGQAEAVQADLWLQTANDVVEYLSLIER